MSHLQLKLLIQGCNDITPVFVEMNTWASVSAAVLTDESLMVSLATRWVHVCRCFRINSWQQWFLWGWITHVFVISVVTWINPSLFGTTRWAARMAIQSNTNTTLLKVIYAAASCWCSDLVFQLKPPSGISATFFWNILHISWEVLNVSFSAHS